MSGPKTGLCSMLMLVLVAAPPSLTAPKQGTDNKTTRAAAVREVIWRDPGNVAALNLFYGAGGKKHAPDPRATFTFVKEDLQATSPKFEIEDNHGVHWKVKLGQEPASETAATRFLWAAGYFVDE